MKRWFTLILGITLGAVMVLVGLATSHQADARATVETEKVLAAMAMEGNASSALINYQGRLLDATTGQPKADGSYQMLFSIFSVANNGSPLWSETKSVTVNKGLFSTLLGDTTALDLTIFNGQDLYLSITVGADSETLPRQRITHSAYAIFANKAENANNATHATTADSATNATKADSATNADHATAADSATNATNATNAANADLLDNLDSTAFAPTAHNHDSAYLNSAGPDDMSASTATYVLNVKQSGAGDGIVGTTAATTPGEAGVEGVGGTASGTLISGGSGVLGDSKSARGVIGVSLDNDGILGFSTNGTGAYGQSLNGIGVRAYSQSGNALQVEGRAQVNGNLTVAGTINNAMAPIALGFINTNGATTVGSSNFASAWNATSKWYEITITGQSYFWTSYVTVVTPTCASISSSTSSVSGKLLIVLNNSAGTNVQCAFQFVTYKP